MGCQPVETGRQGNTHGMFSLAEAEEKQHGLRLAVAHNTALVQLCRAQVGTVSRNAQGVKTGSG